MIKDVLKMGEPLLASAAEPIKDFDTPFLRNLIKDLHDTQRERSGVGIAAPQIGVSKRVIIVGFDQHNERYRTQKPVPVVVLINPEFQPVSDEMIDGWEGCLSVPGLRGLVPRYHEIKYTACSPQGEKIAGSAKDFHARIIQHECDHLNGVLFPQRINDLCNFGFEDALHNRQNYQ